MAIYVDWTNRRIFDSEDYECDTHDGRRGDFVTIDEITACIEEETPFDKWLRYYSDYTLKEYDEFDEDEKDCIKDEYSDWCYGEGFNEYIDEHFEYAGR